MLSRVARNIYWMARYLERGENTARLVSVNSNLLLDLPKAKTTDFGWVPLIAIMGSGKLFYEQYKEPNERNVVKFLLVDTNNPSSVLSSLAQARETMRTLRDIVPVESWEQLNDLYLSIKDKVASGITKRNRYDILKQVILGCQQIMGIAGGTMSRGDAYNFLRVGSYLERADMTTRILDVRSANLLPKQEEESNVKLTPFDNIQWVSVLKSLTAYQEYRRHVRLRVKGHDVLKYLLQDPLFPRAIVFCFNMAESYLNHLPKNDMPLRSLAHVQRQVQAANVYKLAYQHQGLHDFIDELQIGLGQVHDHIAFTYFGVEASETAA